MNQRRWLWWSLLGVGALALLYAVIAALVAAAMGEIEHEALPWILLVDLPVIVVATLALCYRPDHPTARRLVGFAVALVVAEALGIVWASAAPLEPVAAALLAFVGQVAFIMAMVLLTRLLATFPEGCADDRFERLLLRTVPWVLVLPPFMLVASPIVVDPAMGFGFLDVAPTQPFAIGALEPLGPVVAAAYQASQVFVLVAIVALVRRHRRGDDRRRRSIRWLLLPITLVVVLIVLDLVARVAPASDLRETLGPLWMLVFPSTFAALLLGLLRGASPDADVVLRRSLVYTVLWAAIGMSYLTVAAAFGFAAAARLPLGTAVLLTIGATLAFQPARRWLDTQADRWVFGQRVPRYEALAKLSDTLQSALDPDELLPRLAATVHEGLRVAWVRVDVASGDQAPPLVATAGTIPRDGSDAGEVLEVPLRHGDEVLGTIALGAHRRDRLDDVDRDLLEGLAGQVAIGVSVLRLNQRLAAHVEELEASRARLVRVQEDERRRIERDLHDGAQQEVVALMGQVGLARRQLDADDRAAVLLADVQRSLGDLLTSIRELGRGIHPTLLADRGLVEAVEDLASRCPVHVAVRPDRAVAMERYPPEVEGAAYFTVSECLANVLKHAAATTAEVTLRRDNGTLVVSVTDDGRGMHRPAPHGRAPDAAGGAGLRNLGERAAALGGRLDIDSAPGAGTTVTAAYLVEPAARREDTAGV